MDQLTRRHWLKTSACLGLLGVSSNNVQAEEKVSSPSYHWTLLTHWPKESVSLNLRVERLAERIEFLSRGVIKITIKRASSHQAVFDALERGEAQLAYSSSTFFTDKEPGLIFFSNAPLGLIAQEHSGWFHFGGGKKFSNEMYQPHHIQAFQVGHTGTQMCGWFRESVKGLEDIKGMDVSFEGEIMRRVFEGLGAKHHVLSPKARVDALKSGDIMAASWLSPADDMELKFHEAASYYYAPAFQGSGTSFELLVHQPSFNALSDILQDHIEIACDAELSQNIAEYQGKNLESLEALHAQHQVALEGLPYAVEDTLSQKTHCVVKTLLSENKDLSKLYASFGKYRKLSLDMSPMMEKGFIDARLEATSEPVYAARKPNIAAVLD